MKKVEAKGALLEGWDGPKYPAVMYHLDKALAAALVRLDFGFSDSFLNQCAVAKYGVEVQSEPGPKTSDGYRWYHKITWTFADTSFCVLIPAIADDAVQDDPESYPSDRFPALHLSVGMRLEAAETSIWEFIGKIQTTSM